MERIILNEEIITNLGFGEYWGDAGESGTRHLTDPNNENKCFMRIHDIDALPAGSYGGYYQEASPQQYTTDDWKTLTYLDELLEYSKGFPEAYELLASNCTKHNYPIIAPNDERSVATDAQ